MRRVGEWFSSLSFDTTRVIAWIEYTPETFQSLSRSTDVDGVVQRAKKETVDRSRREVSRDCKEEGKRGLSLAH